MSFQEVKFKTIDGIELHAWLYSASQPGPGLVMCPGVSRTDVSFCLLGKLVRDKRGFCKGRQSGFYVAAVVDLLGIRFPSKWTLPTFPDGDVMPKAHARLGPPLSEFNCVLTMINLPACAAALQAHGITVLLYDPRSIGLSSGEPRNNIDPPQSVSDMSDALSHLLTIPSVKTAQAGLFGMSFGGTVALTVAAVDPRCCFVVAAAPLTDLDFISSAHRIRVLRKCAQDRESQSMGNKALTVPLVNSRGENAVGFGHGVDAEKYARLVNGGREIAPGHFNKVTLMTYYRLALWTPWPLWKQLGSGDGDEALRGVAFVVPENDTMSYPEAQRKFYSEVPSTASLQKMKIEVEGAGHEDLFADKHLPVIVDNIVGFIDGLFTA